MTSLQEPPATRTTLADAARYTLKVFLSVQVLLYVVALVGTALLPDLVGTSDSTRALIPVVPGPLSAVSPPGWPAHVVTGDWHNLFTSWERLDALWFLRIATKGYRADDASAAFFPLFPLAVRAVSFLIGGHPLAAGLIVAEASFFGALLVLYLLTTEELSEDAARRAVLYCAVFPTAFFFLSPYSESLFLLLVLLTFLFVRRRRWLEAGVAGALAALTRNLGIVLVLPLAIEAVQVAVHERRESASSTPLLGRTLVARLACSAIPAAGTAAYLTYWGLRDGEWLAPLHRQAYWQRALSDPITAVVDGVRIGFRFLGQYPGGYHQLDLLIGIPVLVLAFAAAVRFRPSYGVYAWASILIPLSLVYGGRPLIAFSRYALPIFPIYWALAVWTGKSRLRHEVVLVASATLLGISTLLFVNWYFII